MLGSDGNLKKPLRIASLSGNSTDRDGDSSALRDRKRLQFPLTWPHFNDLRTGNPYPHHSRRRGRTPRVNHLPQENASFLYWEHTACHFGPSRLLSHDTLHGTHVEDGKP